MTYVFKVVLFCCVSVVPCSSVVLVLQLFYFTTTRYILLRISGQLKLQLLIRLD